MTKYSCNLCEAEFYSAGRNEDYLRCPFCGGQGVKALHVDQVEVTNPSNGVILFIPESVFHALTARHLLSWDGVNERWVYKDEHEVVIAQAIHDTNGPLNESRRYA